MCLLLMNISEGVESGWVGGQSLSGDRPPQGTVWRLSTQEGLSRQGGQRVPRCLGRTGPRPMEVAAPWRRSHHPGGGGAGDRCGSTAAVAVAGQDSSSGGGGRLSVVQEGVTMYHRV